MRYYYAISCEFFMRHYKLARLEAVKHAGINFIWFPFRVIYFAVLIKVMAITLNLKVRNVRRDHFPFKDLIPLDVFEPFVILDRLDVLDSYAHVSFRELFH